MSYDYEPWDEPVCPHPDYEDHSISLDLTNQKLVGAHYVANYKLDKDVDYKLLDKKSGYVQLYWKGYIKILTCKIIAISSKSVYFTPERIDDQVKEGTLTVISIPEEGIVPKTGASDYNPDPNEDTKKNTVIDNTTPVDYGEYGKKEPVIPDETIVTVVKKEVAAGTNYSTLKAKIVDIIENKLFYYTKKLLQELVEFLEGLKKNEKIAKNRALLSATIGYVTRMASKI